jgi:hypothetical protein
VSFYAANSLASAESTHDILLMQQVSIGGLVDA